MYAVPVCLVGRRIVGKKLLCITVFRYSFMLLFESKLFKSVSKSPVITLCFMVLSFSIFDKEFAQ